MSQIVLGHSNSFEDLLESKEASFQQNLPKNKLIRKKSKKSKHHSKNYDHETTNPGTP